jgi:hypothetical protein
LLDVTNVGLRWTNVTSKKHQKRSTSNMREMLTYAVRSEVRADVKTRVGSADYDDLLPNVVLCGLVRGRVMSFTHELALS